MILKKVGARGFYLKRGIFPGLKQTFNIARKSMEQGKIYLWLRINNGNWRFEAAEEFFYHPNGYNILSLKNIFDKDAPN